MHASGNDLLHPFTVDFADGFGGLSALHGKTRCGIDILHQPGVELERLGSAPPQCSGEIRMVGVEDEVVLNWDNGARDFEGDR